MMEVEKAVMNLSKKNKGQTVCATECPCNFFMCCDSHFLLFNWHCPL